MRCPRFGLGLMLLAASCAGSAGGRGGHTGSLAGAPDADPCAPRHRDLTGPTGAWVVYSEPALAVRLAAVRTQPPEAAPQVRAWLDTRLEGLRRCLPKQHPLRPPEHRTLTLHLYLTSERVTSIAATTAPPLDARCAEESLAGLPWPGPGPGPSPWDGVPAVKVQTDIDFAGSCFMSIEGRDAYWRRQAELGGGGAGAGPVSARR